MVEPEKLEPPDGENSGGITGGTTSAPDERIEKLRRLVALARLLRPSDLKVIRESVATWPVSSQDKADIVGMLMAMVRDPEKRKGWRRNKQGASKCVIEIEKLNLKELELALKMLGELPDQAVNVNVGVNVQAQINIPEDEFRKLDPAERIRRFQELAARKADGKKT